jgi:hypothetical protein
VRPDEVAKGLLETVDFGTHGDCHSTIASHAVVMVLSFVSFPPDVSGD